MSCQFGKISILRILLLTGFIAGCQTTPKLTSDDVPKAAIPLFGNCTDADGGATLGFQFGDKTASGLQLDWIKEGVRFAGEVSDPLGARVLVLEGDATKIAFTGPAAKNMETLTVNEGGFIELDGNQIGLKYDELSCFLSYKIPFKWTEYFSRKKVLRKKSDKSTKIVMEFSDGERMIWTTFYPQNRKWCSKIKWNHLLGLVSHKVVVCNDTSTSPWRSKIELGEGDYIEWIKGD